MPRLIVDLRHELPYWTIGPAAAAIVTETPGWEVVIADSEDERERHLAAGAEALWCWHCSAEDARRCPGLRWISTPAAGADYLAAAELLGDGYSVTVSHGHHGPAMAEHALGLGLALARGLDQAPRRAAAGEWWRAAYAGLVIDLMDAPCAVVGVGGIGRAIAERCLAFGLRVVGLGRSAREDPALGFPVVGPDGHDAALREARFVFSSLPGTPENEGFFGRARLESLAAPAVFVNVGRGTTVDEAALVDGVRAGRIRAGLDVLRQEPPPPDHPLRRLAGCLITPHVAAVTDRYLERAAHQQRDQMRRFSAGEALAWAVTDTDLPRARRRL